ncbi:MAG TPA: vWA domain-containing protein, partial [Bryobacteraceae bacterium]
MHNNRWNRQSGIAMILLSTMVATVLVPIIGLAIDGTIMWMIKVKFVAAADSAALAGARSLSAGMDLATQKASAEATAIKYFNANFPPGFWNTTGVNVTATAAQTAMRTRTVTVQGSVQSPLYFLQILGYKTQTIGAQSQSSRRDVNVELVLDRSSSMGGAMTTMLSAAKTFVSQFSEGSDHVGLIVFGGNAVLAFPNPSPSGPAANFKTAVPSVDTLIGQTVGGGNTGTAEALHMAYTELVKKNDAGALNLIVMFTDGLPNGIVADYNDATKDSHGNLVNNYIRTGHCNHRGDAAYPMLGFMSQTNGFTQNSNGADTNGIKTLGTSTVGNVSEGRILTETSAG